MTDRNNVYGGTGQLAAVYISVDELAQKSHWTVTVYSDDGHGNGLPILHGKYEDLEKFLSPEYKLNYPGNPGSKEQQQ